MQHDEPGGTFVGVCGPSGAGKDSVIAYARERLAVNNRVVFVRRVVTRTASPGGEDHLPTDEAGFAAMVADGSFAIWWEAHGLRYGLPEHADADILAGRTVVANVSRAALADLKVRYARLEVAHVTASPDILAQRLAGRGRETEADIARRLARRTIAPDRISGAVEIDNSGPLAIAGDELVGLIERTLQTSPQS